MRLQRHRALVALLLAAALALTWARPLDALGEQHVEAGLKRALVAFAAARTINAVLSALQEASVSVQLGAGVAVKPGAVLEPLDDVVEQFSNLMFVAAASLAVQRLMIELFAAWPVCAALTLLLLAWAALAWRGGALPAWLPRLALALLLLRLAVPVFALVGESVHRLVLERPYQQHAAQLAAAEGQAQRSPAAASGGSGGSGVSGASSAPTAPTAPAAGGGASAGPGAVGLLDRLKAMAAQVGDLGQQVETLRSRAQDVVENLVRLGAVFIVQTVVLPLAYIGFLVWLHRALAAALFDARGGPPLRSARRWAGPAEEGDRR